MDKKFKVIINKKKFHVLQSSRTCHIDPRDVIIKLEIIGFGTIEVKNSFPFVNSKESFEDVDNILNITLPDNFLKKIFEFESSPNLTI